MDWGVKKREKGQAETRLDLTNDLDVSRSVCVCSLGKVLGREVQLF